MALILCGRQSEPVSAEPTETVKEVDTEESRNGLEGEGNLVSVESEKPVDTDCASVSLGLGVPAGFSVAAGFSVSVGFSVPVGFSVAPGFFVVTGSVVSAGSLSASGSVAPTSWNMY